MSQQSSNKFPAEAFWTNCMSGFVCVNKNIKTVWQVLKLSVHLKRTKWRQSVICVCVVMYLYETLSLHFSKYQDRKKWKVTSFLWMHWIKRTVVSLKGFFCTLKLRIPIHYLCHQNITYSTQAQASLILEFKILGLVPKFDPFPDKFLSLSLVLFLYFFYRSWFLLRFLCLWDITAIKVCVRSYNAIHFAWSCVYDMIGIWEQVGNWENVPSDSECGILWLQQDDEADFFALFLGTSYCSCSDTRNSSVFLTFFKDQIISGSGPWR